jgi:hypothetical protein
MSTIAVRFQFQPLRLFRKHGIVSLKVEFASIVINPQGVLAWLPQ